MAKANSKATRKLLHKAVLKANRTFKKEGKAGARLRAKANPNSSRAKRLATRKAARE